MAQQTTAVVVITHRASGREQLYRDSGLDNFSHATADYLARVVSKRYAGTCDVRVVDLTESDPDCPRCGWGLIGHLSEPTGCAERERAARKNE